MFDDWKAHNSCSHEDIAHDAFEMAMFNDAKTSRQDEINPWDNHDSGC